MSILITGASGALGRRVTDHVLEMVDPSELILVTRSPDALVQLTDRGITVRHGDFDEPSTLPSAFAGANKMLLVSTNSVGDRVAQHEAAIDAAAEVGIELVAYTSIVNPVADNPAYVVPDHLGTEEKLLASGLAWIFLRNSLYAEFQKSSMNAAARSGVLPTNEGSGLVAHVSRDDCAAAAAAVLLADDQAGKSYDITGPELMDAEDRAKVFSSITGHPIEVVQLDDDAYAKGLADATGMPVAAARATATFGAATRGGYFDVISSDFESLTGRPPMSLHTVLS